MTATQKTYTTTFNFSNYEEMDYCFSTLECYLKGFRAERDEFDGGTPNEVRIFTTTPIPATTLKRMLKHFAPKKHRANQ